VEQLQVWGSRAIYRQLADEITEDLHGARAPRNHERVLRACEAAVERLMTDRRYTARPARTLFQDIRAYFPAASQLRVLRVIEHFLGLVEQYVGRLPPNGLDVSGNPLRVPPPVERARHASGCPCRTTAIARLTSTSQPPKNE
jgi:hypothetical protein